MSTQEILYDVASQSLAFEFDRPVSSVTSVAVYELDAGDDTTAESATTGSAAVDTATEATTAAAGASEADPAKLTVASTAGFVAGRRAYISGGGLSETFEIARISTNAALYARHPLVNDYATGATVDMSTRVTISVSDTWAADKNNISPSFNPNPRYRVRIVLVHGDDSTTAVYLRNFDLVRYPSAPPVSPLDVDRAHPGWIDRLPPDYRDSQGRPLIVEATRDVRFDLWHRGIADQALRSGEAFAALVIARAVLASIEANARLGSDAAIAAYPIAKDGYDRRLAGLVDSPRLALDDSGSGAAATKTGSSEPVWMRSR